MPGVQIHHKELRDAVLVYEIPDWKYGVPFACPTCQTVHVNKAVHLRFDSVGDCVVAEPTWNKIKGHLKGHVKVGKRISDPEPIVLGVGGGNQEAFQVVRVEV